jgi:hypothetical protein
MQILKSHINTDVLILTNTQWSGVSFFTCTSTTTTPWGGMMLL